MTAEANEFMDKYLSDYNLNTARRFLAV